MTLLPEPAAWPGAQVWVCASWASVEGFRLWCSGISGLQALGIWTLASGSVILVPRLGQHVSHAVRAVQIRKPYTWATTALHFGFWAQWLVGASSLKDHGT